MLEPIRHVLTSQRIVLASGSPRRKEIFSKLNLPFEIVTSTFEENLCKKEFSEPAEYAKETARHKATEVTKRLLQIQNPPDIVLGCDTVVSLDGQIYEKPKDKNDAVRLLSLLSGRKNFVNTGCILMVKSKNNEAVNNGVPGYHQVVFHETTGVQMGILSPEVIQKYVDSGEPMDKAGGYGIQALGATIIEGVEGDYYNVMGLPIYRVCKEIYKLYESGLIS